MKGWSNHRGPPKYFMSVFGPPEYFMSVYGPPEYFMSLYGPPEYFMSLYGPLKYFLPFMVHQNGTKIHISSYSQSEIWHISHFGPPKYFISLYGPPKYFMSLYGPSKLRYHFGVHRYFALIRILKGWRNLCRACAWHLSLNSYSNGYANYPSPCEG